MLPKTDRITLSTGLSTRVLDTGGDGPPVLLVHGLAASIEIWENVIDDLRADHRVMAFDLPGFGWADKPKRAKYNIAFFRSQFAAVLDYLNLDRVHVVGSSMGASLIVRSAPEQIARYASASLLDPGGFARYVHPFLRIPTVPLLGYLLATPMTLTNIYAVHMARGNRKVPLWPLVKLQNELGRQPGYHRAFVRTLRGFASPFGVYNLKAFADEARQLTTPTLLIWGDKDRIFPPAQSRQAEAMLPDLRNSIIMDKCGHFPQLDQPQETSRLIREHIEAAER